MGESFGGLLRAHRRAAGLTQEALAELALLSAQAIGALERGDRRFPRRDTVFRLAEALGLTGEPRAVLVAAASRRGRPRVAIQEAVRGEPRARACRRALPCDVADFTGRAGELDTCERLVSRRSDTAPLIVAVSGMAGCGKSTLAVRAAHRFADRFPDGQFFIDLHGHTPGHEPLQAQVALADLLRCLGIPGVEVPTGLEQRSTLRRSELADRRTLIVLDNALDAGQVRPLLPGSPGHLVLVTSRHRLADLDGAVDLPLEPMPAPDAARLFMRVAQRREGDPDAVTEVVRLCGRLPLAIRLAATRLRHRRTWTVAGLTERLRDQQQRLGELSAGSRSVAGAFELSYRQLTAQQQRVFRLLSLHPGADIDPYATAALCGTGVDDARRGLEHLADVHLLREHAPDRYTFHDLLRDYASAAADRQEPVEERQAALRRLVDYYLCAAARANRVADPFRRPDPVAVDRPAAELPSFPGPHEVLGWWEAERANLLRAIDAAVLAGRDVQAWQLAQALVPFFSQTGNAQDRHDTQRIALGSARRVGDPVAEANILVDLGSACHRLGRLSEARTHLETAASLAGRVGDAHAEARTLNRLAIVDQAGGDYARAERHLTTALALFRCIGDHRHEGGTLASLATLYEHAGRYTESLRIFAEALSIMDRLGPLVYSGRVHEGLAWLYLRLGRHDEGCAQFDHALGLAREVSDREGTVRALLGLGYGHVSSGRLDDALTFLRRVLEAADRGVWIGNMRARALRGIALVHSRRGRYSEAVDLQEEALLIARTYRRRILQVTILNDLADTHAAAGRHADAAGCYRRAGALALEIDVQAGQHPAESRLGQEQARAHDGLARLP